MTGRSGGARRLSGPSRSAIAVWQVLQSVPGLGCPPAPQVRLRSFGRGDASEGVVVTRVSPDEFELTTHGGEAVADRTAAELRRHGLAAAAATLPPAATARTRMAAAWHIHLSKTDFEHRLREAGNRRWTDAEVHRLVTFGRWLRRPPSILLFGLPNVGKSSLANAILGYERAIVYDREGVTRDQVAVPVAFGGWPAELVDTAGVEGETTPAEADITVLVLDGSRPMRSIEIEWLESGRATLVAVTKSDLPSDTQVAASIRVSALRPHAAQPLGDALARHLQGYEPAATDPIPLCDDHERRLADLADHDGG